MSQSNATSGIAELHLDPATEAMACELAAARNVIDEAETLSEALERLPTSAYSWPTKTVMAHLKEHRIALAMALHDYRVTLIRTGRD